MLNNKMTDFYLQAKNTGVGAPNIPWCGKKITFDENGNYPKSSNEHIYNEKDKYEKLANKFYTKYQKLRNKTKLKVGDIVLVNSNYNANFEPAKLIKLSKKQKGYWLVEFQNDGQKKYKHKSEIAQFLGNLDGKINLKNSVLDNFITSD